MFVHAPLRPRGIVAELELPKGALLAHEWSFHVHQQSEPIDEFAPIQMQVRTSVPHQPDGSIACQCTMFRGSCESNASLQRSTMLAASRATERLPSSNTHSLSPTAHHVQDHSSQPPPHSQHSGRSSLFVCRFSCEAHKTASTERERTDRVRDGVNQTLLEVPCCAFWCARRDAALSDW